MSKKDKEPPTDHHTNMIIEEMIIRTRYLYGCDQNSICILILWSFICQPNTLNQRVNTIEKSMVNGSKIQTISTLMKTKQKQSDSSK